MKKWTNHEIKILIENYSIIGASECEKLFNNTSKRQIQQKAQKLGLTFNRIDKKYQYEFFKNIIENSSTISDATRKLGLSTGRGNRKTITNYIKIYNIPTNHFQYKPIGNVNKLQKHKISEVLVENSTYTWTSTLKKRLYKEGLKKPICELCGQNENWFGMKISLILDHINGINNDNRLENLQILCPNCNAGQETFCRGNKRKKQINKNNDKYLKSKINQRKVKRPLYEQLINEINELGYCATGRKYSVSDSAIRKWVKFYEKYEMQG